MGLFGPWPNFHCGDNSKNGVRCPHRSLITLTVLCYNCECSVPLLMKSSVTSDSLTRHFLVGMCRYTGSSGPSSFNTQRLFIEGLQRQRYSRIHCNDGSPTALAHLGSNPSKTTKDNIELYTNLRTKIQN